MKKTNLMLTGCTELLKQGELQSEVLRSVKDFKVDCKSDVKNTLSEIMDLNSRISEVNDDFGFMLETASYKHTVAKVNNEDFVVNNQYIFQTTTLNTNECDLVINNLDRNISELKEGHSIYIEDHRLAFTIEKIEEFRLICRCIKNLNNPKIGDKVYFPNTDLSFSELSNEDIDLFKDLVLNNFMPRYICASYADSRHKLINIKRTMTDIWGSNDIRLIAKIESAKSIANIHEVLEVCSGIFIDRKSLVVSLGYKHFNRYINEIINIAYDLDKIVFSGGDYLITSTTNNQFVASELSDLYSSLNRKIDCIVLCETVSSNINIKNTVDVFNSINEQFDVKKSI